MNLVEQFVNMDDIEYVDDAGSYVAHDYEPATTDWEMDSDEMVSSRRWTVWHVIALLILLVVVAAVLVFVVLPYITSLTTGAPAVHLPTPVQA